MCEQCCVIQLTAILQGGGGGGVGLNSSVTECPIEIILSGMTYYHHWFEEFVKSKHICVHFFQMKVHFRIYLIVWIVGSIQILLDCVWPFELRFYGKKREF